MGINTMLNHTNTYYKSILNIYLMRRCTVQWDYDFDARSVYMYTFFVVIYLGVNSRSMTYYYIICSRLREQSS